MGPEWAATHSARKTISFAPPPPTLPPRVSVSSSKRPSKYHHRQLHSRTSLSAPVKKLGACRHETGPAQRETELYEERYWRYLVTAAEHAYPHPTWELSQLDIQVIHMLKVITRTFSFDPQISSCGQVENGLAVRPVVPSSFLLEAPHFCCLDRASPIRIRQVVQQKASFRHS